jgi:hypothetical protein
VSQEELMPFDADDIRAAKELNRLWDAVNLSNPIEVEQSDRAMLDRLAACDDAPVPDEAFAGKLRTTLMALPEPVVTTSRHAIGIVKPLNAPWPFVSGRRIAVAAALAACLTLIVSASGGFLRDQANAPTVSSVLASPAGSPTAGPTMTAWLESNAKFSLDHEVSLLPEIAATATGNSRSLIAPSTTLTVLETQKDIAGRSWLLVETGDGRAGWLPGNVTATIGQ